MTPGGSANYIVAISPVGGFTSNAELFGGRFANELEMVSFNLPSIVITNASWPTSTLTVTTTALSPLGSLQALGADRLDEL